MTLREYIRCWHTNDALLIDYHDNEWGTPLHDDRALFESLVLLCMADEHGLVSILKKRARIKRLLDDFDFERIALYGERRLQSILHGGDLGLSYKRLDVIIACANAFKKLRVEFGTFDRYIWQYAFLLRPSTEQGTRGRAHSPGAVSAAICKDLKSRGFKGISSKVVLDFIRATGIVNNHEHACFRYRNLAANLA